VTDPRPRDAARTRERILATARQHFSAHGYDRATVRTIAAGAGVSPNLITRYFGSKRGLFAAAAETDLHIEEVLQGPVSQLGGRIAARVVARWESQPGDDPLLMMMRASMSDPDAAEHMASFFRHQTSQPLARYLGSGDADERAAAVGSLIMGTVIQRYVMRAGPVAWASADEVRGWLACGLQLLLTGGESGGEFSRLGAPAGASATGGGHPAGLPEPAGRSGPAAGPGR
jgi:AcrR family transcriptional regulator